MWSFDHILSIPLVLCLLVPGLYWFYYWAFSGSLRKPFPAFHPKRETFLKHRAKIFPPPYPNGWFKIANMSELENGQIKSVSALGHEFVVYLDGEGKPVVLDAFCPHQGAHLGGGKVVDGCIQCPFHEWEFNSEGKACKIPYFTGSKIPDFAKTKSWPVQTIQHLVFVWHHADGEPPSWDLMQRPHLKDRSKYYYFGAFQGEFDMHIMEMAENSPDYAHFNVLHKNLPIPFFGRFLKIEFFDLNMSFDSDPKKHHIHYFHNKAQMWFLNKKLDNYPPQVTDLIFEGPAIINFQLSSPFGKIELIKTLIPIAPFHVYNEDHWFGENSVPRWFLYIYAKFASYALDQDRPVWDTKSYKAKPILVKGDGPWPAHRRWWSQFYSPNSYRMEGNINDW
eukprot:TRINITY_DN1179_c1_g1_i1.p1 TRINITY_DN1179_c1_g1~~TRINITY_DN1179_c1_g1_i1.p1  ORF type:complete len:393 (+),score=78.99 TRINITY_DN1179_c1_g1_i1:42-1220(+)